MSQAATELKRGDSLALWELSAITERPFAGDAAPAEDRQNYKYINGFVDTGDLPCRVATWQEVATRQMALETDWQVESLYLPGKARRVEFTRFHHMPTRLSRWCRTFVSSPRDRYCSFRLSTSGGVHIWVDGALAARFEPFTRNNIEETVVHLPLRQEGSEVVVFMEEMAERDTMWFFELALLDDVTLDVNLPGASRGSHTAILSHLASEVRPEKECLTDGALTLVFDTPAALPVSIQVDVNSTSHDQSQFQSRTLELAAGATRLEIVPIDDLPEGYLTIALAFFAGDTRVDRTIGCAVLRTIEPKELPGTLDDRKRLALEHTARHGEKRIGTVLAKLALGHSFDARCAEIVDRTLHVVENRHDCADFVMVPLLWIFKRYAEALPIDVRDKIEAAVLGFRYWVDEPGNDVMWFWSENHALCFHVSQLLAGELFPDTLFSASRRLGAEQHSQAVDRLNRWFDAVEAEGLAEWNSAAYYPVDLIGLLALIEFAPKALAARAKRVTDGIFTMTALHTTGGVPAGTMGRAYDKELRAGPLTELAPFAAVAWGRGWFNRGVASVPQFAAGEYVPPENLKELAWPEAGTKIQAHYVQGYKDAAKLALFKTADLQLSTNTASDAGAYGHQQHVVDLLFASHPYARAWINHPGEDDPWGTRRPSYWAGNGVLPRAAQQENLALLSYDLGLSPRIDFTHAYVSSVGIEVEHDAQSLLLKSETGLAAILCSQMLVPVTSGPGAGIEFRAYGNRTSWALIAALHRDIALFRRELAGTHLRLDQGTMRTSLSRPGIADMVLDWNGTLRIGAQTIPVPEHSVVPVISKTPLSTSC